MNKYIENLTKAEPTVALDKILRLKDLSDEIISLKGNGSICTMLHFYRS